MAVRLSAANQRYLAGGFSGAVATILFWGRLSATPAANLNWWVLYNTNEASADESGLGNAGGASTQIVLYDSAFTQINGPSMTVGTWYCMAIVMNSTAYSISFGTDPQSLTTNSGTRVAMTSPGAMTLSHQTDFVNGNIAAFKMYTAALTATEIQDELSQYQPLRTDQLLRYHPFVNAETADYSGAGGTLTIPGGGTPTTEAGPPIRWDGRLFGRHIITPLTGPPVNATAGNAPIGMTARDATVTVSRKSPAAGNAPIGMAAQNATVRISTNAAASAAAIGLASLTPSRSIKASPGFAHIITHIDNPTAVAFSLACANLSATILVESLSALVTVDEHSAEIVVDELSASVGAEELFSDTSICGRS